MAMDVAPEPASPGSDDDIPAAPAAEIVAAFASRRTAAIAAATAGTAKAVTAPAGKIPSVGAAPGVRPTVPRPSMAHPAAGPGTRETVPFPQKSSAAPKPAINKSGKTIGAFVTAPGILGVKRERSVVPLPTAGGPEAKEAAARRSAATPGFGLGSKAAPVKAKPRYLGLILTVILLVLLAAVAAWSSFFMVANNTSGTGAATVPVAGSASLTAPVTTSPSPAPNAAAATTGQKTSVPTDMTSAENNSAAAPDAAAPVPEQGQAEASKMPAEPTAGTTADNTTAADPAAQSEAPDVGKSAVVTGEVASTTAALQPAAPQPVTPIEPAPKTEVSTAGIAAIQPAGTPQDTINVANADTAPKAPGPMRLATLVSSADASPSAAPPPPPYGTIYKFDAQGRIVPTPEGILTPEGVLLVAGKPKVLPPDRPADLTPKVQTDSVQTAEPKTPEAQSAATAGSTGTAALSATAPQGNAAATDTAAAAVPDTASQTAAAPAPAADATAPSLPQDPTLRGKHPKDRPTNLTPPPDPQGALPDASAENGVASLRPQARPAGITSPIAADTGADVNTASASLAANGFALISSPKPPARPANLKTANLKTTNLNTGNLNSAVDQAVNVVLNQPVIEAANSQSPDAGLEPEIETTAPNLPTNASVAKQATTRHALNGSKVALLAVFGSSSTRFAMVRQANGAVKKVQVGDSVDGGRIGSITDSSVQYSKGGQIVTLSMPAG